MLFKQLIWPYKNENTDINDMNMMMMQKISQDLDNVTWMTDKLTSSYSFNDVIYYHVAQSDITFPVRILVSGLL